MQTIRPGIEISKYITIEAIIIHVLCTVFNSTQELPIVRVARLIELLDNTVRIQAVIKQAWERDKTILSLKERQKVTRGHKYTIGLNLLLFLDYRGLIHIHTVEGESFQKSDGKKSVSYTSMKKLYANCNFDLSLLPIKMNLPMVSPPINWSPAKGKAKTLDDLEGGYLSGIRGGFYNRFRLLTSHDIDHFYIELENSDSLCSVLNTLQSQVFEINKPLLYCIVIYSKKSF